MRSPCRSCRRLRSFDLEKQAKKIPEPVGDFLCSINQPKGGSIFAVATQLQLLASNASVLQFGQEFVQTIFRQLNEAVDAAIGGQTDPWLRLEAACAAHLTLLVGSQDESLVAATSLFHPADATLQRRLNRDRNAYEERFRIMIGALQVPEGIDETLVRLALLGAINWTRIWYRPGRRTPAQIARHLVQKVLRTSLG